jgi:GH24 family phage-related lysozyme (muramidase)
MEHLILREGKRLTVYKDSLGKPTVGVGHLVLPEDNLKLGDSISEERCKSFLDKDMTKAFLAAQRQTAELKYLVTEECVGLMIEALTSVNFQLGTTWNKTFKNTWAMIVKGDLVAASEAVKDSKWYVQTPVRVNDFAAALKEIDSKIRWKTAR